VQILLFLNAAEEINIFCEEWVILRLLLLLMNYIIV
jgi:hypothetical protein